MPDDPSSPFAERPPETEAGEFTRIFGRPAPAALAAQEGTSRPAAAPAAAPAPAAAAAPYIPSVPPMPAATPEAEAGEFTQIFSPAARPSTPTPPVAAAPAAKAAEAGEFTQFFSALSSRSAPAPPQAAPQSAPSRAAVPAPPAQEAAQPGTFTQLAQQILAAPEQPPAAPPQRAATPAPAPQAQTFSTGEPSRSGGGLTGIFSQPPAGSAAPAPQPAASRDGGFTEMFRAVANPAPTAPPMPAAPPPAPVRAPEPLPSFAPQRPAESAGAGEFTRLMQNLAQKPEQQPAQGYTLPAPYTPPQMQEPVLNAPAGGSEFTRVLRGDALRESGAAPGAQGPAAVSQGAPRAPGLAIAPEKVLTQATAAVQKKKNHAMLILGLVNGLLLLALGLIALTMLHHHK